MRFKDVMLAAFLAGVCGGAWADGLASLESFLRHTQSLRSDFTQVVHSPAREGQAPRARSSSGVFEFQRPDRFRFVYKKPFPQTIVADGKTLWLYDVDLQQASARQQADALGATPAALIAGRADMQALQNEFLLESVAGQDGLQWVKATPKNREAQLQSVRIGLRMQGASSQLAVLEILDALGQRSVLSFDKQDINPRLPSDTFVFTPPAGVSVLRP